MPSGSDGRRATTRASAITHVIFDFDGTLVDSNALKEDGFATLSSAHPGGAAVMEHIRREVRGDRRTRIAAYVKAMAESLPSLSLDVDELLARYSAAVDREVAAAPAMPGAVDLLERLGAAGRRCYVSSATPVENLRGVVAARGWTPFFDGLFGYPQSKIDTLRHLMADAGAPAGFAVVGDGEDDRDSAAAAGCTFFSVGEGRGRNAADPLYSLAELARLIVPAT